MRQPVASVVPETRPVARLGAQQPVQRHGAQSCEPGTVSLAEVASGLAHRLLQPSGGLPRGSRQGDPEVLATGLCLFVQRHEQAGHRRGLAGAGTSRDDRGPPRGCVGAGGALLVETRVGEHSRQRGRQERLIELRG